MSLLKKSFTIGNHRTSISLEPEFWDALEIKASEQDVSLSKLVLNKDSAERRDVWFSYEDVVLAVDDL